MAVRIQKPAVNIREKLAELERPIGLNGVALMSTNTPQEAFSLIGAGRRNLVINGDFQVSQRGSFTTSSTIGSTRYQLDRWYSVIYNGNDTMQHKLNEVLPNGSITNSVRITTAVTGYVALDQYIENPSIYSGKTFTVSFWIKTNCSTTEVNIYNGSLFVLASTLGKINETSGDWKYCTRTFTMPSSGNTSFRVEFYTGNGAASPAGSYIEVAQVQVEEGRIATPFEYRSYGQELQLCQRYYEKSFEDTTTPINGSTSTSFGTELGLTVGWAGHRGGYASNSYPGRSVFARFKVSKRVTPTITLFGNNGGLPYIYDTTNGHRWVTAAWGAYSNKEGFEMSNEFSSAAMQFAFSHWTASAEL